jgi:hypothetical protein
MRRVVVFPHPEGPSRTTYSPWSMCRLKSSTATTPPAKTFVTPRSSRPDPFAVEGAAFAAPSETTDPLVSGA